MKYDKADESHPAFIPPRNKAPVTRPTRKKDLVREKESSLLIA